MGKLQNIIDGWRGYLFEGKETEAMAMKRAKVCADCEHAVTGMIAQFIEDDIKDIEGLVCGLCDCPLSAKCRSKFETCKAGKWQ